MEASVEVVTDRRTAALQLSARFQLVAGFADDIAASAQTV
jgi:hypothetical protein